MIKACECCGQEFLYDDTMKVNLKMWDAKVLNYVCENCYEEIISMQKQEEELRKIEPVKEYGE